MYNTTNFKIKLIFSMEDDYVLIRNLSLHQNMIKKQCNISAPRFKFYLSICYLY